MACRRLGRIIICSKGIISQMIALCKLTFGDLFYVLFDGISARENQQVEAANFHKDEVILDLIRDMGVRQIIYFDDQAEDHHRLMEMSLNPIHSIDKHGRPFVHTTIQRSDYYYHQVPQWF